MRKTPAIISALIVLLVTGASAQPWRGPKVSVDGDLGEWGDLQYEKIDGVGGSAGFRFGVSYDKDYLYIACHLKDDVWIARPTLGKTADGIKP